MLSSVLQHILANKGLRKPNFLGWALESSDSSCVRLKSRAGLAKSKNTTQADRHTKGLLWGGALLPFRMLFSGATWRVSPNFPPGCQFSGGPACYRHPVFHLSSLFDVCSLEGLGDWLWAHLVPSKVERARNAVFQTRGNETNPSSKKVWPHFSPPSKGNSWRPSSLTCVGAHPTSFPQRRCLLLNAAHSCWPRTSFLRPELQLGLGRKKFASFKLASSVTE